MTAAMLLGRYLPIALVLALAGTLAKQRPRAITAATLRAEGATVAVLIASSAVILALLTFIPALSLGAIADAL